MGNSLSYRPTDKISNYGVIPYGREEEAEIAARKLLSNGHPCGRCNRPIVKVQTLTFKSFEMDSTPNPSSLIEHVCEWGCRERFIPCYVCSQLSAIGSRHSPEQLVLLTDVDCSNLVLCSAVCIQSYLSSYLAALGLKEDSLSPFTLRTIQKVLLETTKSLGKDPKLLHIKNVNEYLLLEDRSDFQWVQQTRDWVSTEGRFERECSILRSISISDTEGTVKEEAPHRFAREYSTTPRSISVGYRNGTVKVESSPSSFPSVPSNVPIDDQPTSHLIPAVVPDYHLLSTKTPIQYHPQAKSNPPAKFGFRDIPDWPRRSKSTHRGSKSTHQGSKSSTDTDALPTSPEIEILLRKRASLHKQHTLLLNLSEAEIQRPRRKRIDRYGRMMTEVSHQTLLDRFEGAIIQIDKFIKEMQQQYAIVNDPIEEATRDSNKEITELSD